MYVLPEIVAGNFFGLAVANNWNCDEFVGSVNISFATFRNCVLHV